MPPLSSGASDTEGLINTELQLQNNRYLFSRNAAGSGIVNIIKINTSNQVEFGDGTVLDSIGSVPPGAAFVVASDAGSIIRTQAENMNVTYGNLVLLCDGTADDVQIQAALDAIPSGGGTVFLSSGTFNISASIKIPTGAVLMGNGASTVLSATSGITADTDFGSTAYYVIRNKTTAGDSDFRITNLKCDMTNKDVAGAHCIHIHNSDHFMIDHCWTNFGNDGVAVTTGNDWIVSSNICENHSNCALDTWWTSRRGVFSNNTVNGGGGLYGVLVTGLTTADAATTTQEIRVIGNHINNVANVGIWLQGGLVSGGGSEGVTQDCVVDGNIIENVTAFHGIRLSAGSRHVVSNNIIKTIYKNGILFDGELAASGASSDCLIANNIIVDTSVEGSGIRAAIHLADTGADRNILVGNIFRGSNHSYSIDIAANADSNIVHSNQLTGTVAGLRNLGTSNNIHNNTVWISENYGTSTQSGTGSTTSFNIAHGLSTTPTSWSVTANNAATVGAHYVTADSTNLTVVYANPPASGSNNLTWKWQAQV